MGQRRARLWVFVSSHFISLGPVRAWGLGPSQARILTVPARIGKAAWCLGWRASTLGFGEHPARFVSVAGEANRWVLRLAAHFRHRRSGQTMRRPAPL